MYSYDHSHEHQTHFYLNGLAPGLVLKPRQRQLGNSLLLWFCFTILCDWFKKNSRHLLNQSNAKPNPITFSRAWRRIRVFATSSDWFIVLFTNVLQSAWLAHQLPSSQASIFHRNELTVKDWEKAQELGKLTRQFLDKFPHWRVNSCTILGLVSHALSPVVVLDNDKRHFPGKKRRTLIITHLLPKSNLESINVVVPFESVDETLVCDHSNESY